MEEDKVGRGASMAEGKPKVTADRSRGGVRSELRLCSGPSVGGGTLSIGGGVALALRVNEHKCE